jgi:sn-glycerol 3-phosphate transport system substrate-binding protein
LTELIYRKGHLTLLPTQNGQSPVRNPDQWTAFAQLTSGNNTPNTQGIRLGNFVAVRDAIEDELENILARKKSVQQGLDDAVVKGNEILKEFASSYNK